MTTPVFATLTSNRLELQLTCLVSYRLPAIKQHAVMLHQVVTSLGCVMDCEMQLCYATAAAAHGMQLAICKPDCLSSQTVPFMSICMASREFLGCSAKRPMLPASPAMSKSAGISTRLVSVFATPFTAALVTCTSASYKQLHALVSRVISVADGSLAICAGCNSCHEIYCQLAAQQHGNKQCRSKPASSPLGTPQKQSHITTAR